MIAPYNIFKIYDLFQYPKVRENISPHIYAAPYNA